ncbi:MAG: GNAT family N-acetyltransferase [Spirochaetota bacterium]
MMKNILIEDLSNHINFIPILAQWHFTHWGDLTGALTESDYQDLLSKQTHIQKFPLTLVAVDCGRLLGSVNIVSCDMDIKSELTPWISQLYVHPSERSKGIGSTLVYAAIARIREIGFSYLYLYTSGTLPSFYQQIGWKNKEVVYYKGKKRIIMEIRLLG